MLKRAVFLGCLILLTAGTAWSADDTFPMPENMQKLLPAEPAFILAITSVNDLDRQWRAIEEMLDDGDGETHDLIDMLNDQMPRFAEFADLDRPLVITMGLPDLMAGEEPAVTFIVPLKDLSRSDMEMMIDREDIIYLREGDYLALSNAPEYSPAAETPSLARDLSAGFITGSLDLELIITAYRPLIDMSMGSMAMKSAQVDTTGTGEEDSGPDFENEDFIILSELVSTLMDSARRMDMALRVENDILTLHSGFSAHPGSALDPGPQPLFEDALQLTRLLPDGGNIIQTMAMDQRRQFEVFRNFYTASMEKEIAKMDPEQGAAYRAWFDSYLDSIDLFANPVAVSLKMETETVSANLVMKCADAPATLERFAVLFDGLSAADIGIQMKKLPTGKVAGSQVRSWTVKYDAEKLAGISPDPASPHLTGPGRMETDQMVAFLRKVTPSINMATRGDYLILSADTNPANLAHMIQEAGQRRGAANPAVAAVAAKAGPACQQVVTGDLMAILSWITEWLEELEDEEYAAIEGNPIPFTSAFTIDGADYGVDWSMDMPAVERFAKAVQEMEAMDDLNDDESEEKE